MLKVSSFKFWRFWETSEMISHVYILKWAKFCTAMKRSVDMEVCEINTNACEINTNACAFSYEHGITEQQWRTNTARTPSCFRLLFETCWWASKCQFLIGKLNAPCRFQMSSKLGDSDDLFSGWKAKFQFLQLIAINSYNLCDPPVLKAPT